MLSVIPPDSDAFKVSFSAVPLVFRITESNVSQECIPALLVLFDSHGRAPLLLKWAIESELCVPRTFRFSSRHFFVCHSLYLSLLSAS